MQRTASILLASLVAGLFMTGCPEKNAEKEDPAGPAVARARHHAATDDKAVDDEHADEGADDHGDEAKDEKRPQHHHKKDQAAGQDKDQGGW